MSNPVILILNRPRYGEAHYDAFSYRVLNFKRKFYRILNMIADQENLNWNTDQLIYFRWSHVGKVNDYSPYDRMHWIPNTPLVRQILVYFEDLSRNLYGQGFYDHLFSSRIRNHMIPLHPLANRPIIPGSNDGVADRVLIRAQMNNSPLFIHYRTEAERINELAPNTNLNPIFRNSLNIFQGHIPNYVSRTALQLQLQLRMRAPAPVPAAAPVPFAPPVPAAPPVPFAGPVPFPPPVPAAAPVPFADPVPFAPPVPAAASVPFPAPVPFEHLMPAPGPDRGGPSTARFAPYGRPPATVSVAPHDIVPDLGGPSTGGAGPYRSPSATLSVAPPDVAPGPGESSTGRRVTLALRSPPARVSAAPHDIVPDLGGPSTGGAGPYRSPSATLSVAPPDVVPGPGGSSMGRRVILPLREPSATVRASPHVPVPGPGEASRGRRVTLALRSPPATVRAAPHDIVPDLGGPSTGGAGPHRRPTSPVSFPPHDVLPYPLLAGPPDDNQEEDDEANPPWVQQLVEDFEARAAQPDHGVPPAGPPNEGPFANQEPNILQNVPSPYVNVLEPVVVEGIDRDDLEDLGDIQEYLDEQ